MKKLIIFALVATALVSCEKYENLNPTARGRSMYNTFAYESECVYNDVIDPVVLFNKYLAETDSTTKDGYKNKLGKISYEGDNIVKITRNYNQTNLYIQFNKNSLKDNDWMVVLESSYSAFPHSLLKNDVQAYKVSLDGDKYVFTDSLENQYVSLNMTFQEQSQQVISSIYKRTYEYNGTMNFNYSNGTKLTGTMTNIKTEDGLIYYAYSGKLNLTASNGNYEDLITDIEYFEDYYNLTYKGITEKW